MGLNFASGGKKKSNGRVEDGTYMARIVRLIDLGIQHNTNFRTSKPQYHVLDDKGQWLKNGNDFVYTDEPNDSPDLSQKLWIDFEFPTETIDIDGASRPRWQGKEFTFSMNEKAALYKLIHAADPGLKHTNKGRSPAKLLGLPLMVTVGSTSGNKAKITTVSPLMKGMAVPELENPSAFFDMSDPDMEVWEKLPSWLQERIKAAVDFEETALAKKLSGATSVSTDGSEDNPF